MCKQVIDGKRGNMVIYFVIAVAAISSYGLAFAAEIPVNPLDAAERVEKLSAMGVMAFCLMSSLGALAFLIKLQYGRMMSVIDKNTEATQKVIDVMWRCAEHNKNSKG